MATSEMKNAPPIYGWAIAAAAGLVAGAVSFLLVGIEGNGSVAIAAVITLVVGLVFTIAETPAAPAKGPVLAKASAPAPTSKPAPAPAALPEAAAPVAAAASASAEPAPTGDAAKPAMLTAPVGAADDLKQISGVGPVLEGKLNELGVYHFWQIARWSPSEVEWVDGFLNFKGRIERDGWIAQATTLAATSPAQPPA